MFFEWYEVCIVDWCRVFTGNGYLLLQPYFAELQFETIWDNLMSVCLALLNDLEVWQLYNLEVWQL